MRVSGDGILGLCFLQSSPSNSDAQEVEMIFRTAFLSKIQHFIFFVFILFYSQEHSEVGKRDVV